MAWIREPAEGECCVVESVVLPFQSRLPQVEHTLVASGESGHVSEVAVIAVGEMAPAELYVKPRAQCRAYGQEALSEKFRPSDEVGLFDFIKQFSVS